MKVKEAVRRAVPTCTLMSTLDQVGRLMWEGDQVAIPVVDAQGRAVGILSDRDLAMALTAKNRGAAQILVRELMQGELVCCAPEDQLADAVKTMRSHRLRSLCVVDPERHVVGILSLEDLAYAALSSEDLVSMLQAIGKTRKEAGEDVPDWPWVNAPR